MRLRSKFAAYTFAGIQFGNGVAETNDTALIQRIKASPDFGPGRDFWEDHAPPAEAIAAAERNGGGDKAPEKSGKK